MATNIRNLSNLDWDDTALQKAYDKGVKLRAKFLEQEAQKSKNPKKSTPAKENAKPEEKWKIGDFCQAIYSADKQPYEAKICNIGDGVCTVEFVGYGDKQSVNVRDLKQSHGKKARRKQYKAAQTYSGGCSSVSESCSNVSDSGSRRPCSGMKFNESRAYEQESFNYPVADNSTYPVQHSHIVPNYAPPPPVPPNMPFLPKPPAPPMPMCPSISQNPSLTAMLVSWYMAGYYTGLHQAPKGPQCSQRCCNHANQCCHH